MTFSSAKEKDKVIHYPTLKTILMVEKVLKESGEPLKKTEIKSRLPKKIMHQTLSMILDYLEERGLVLYGRKGYLWVYNPSEKLWKEIRKGRAV